VLIILILFKSLSEITSTSLLLESINVYCWLLEESCWLPPTHFLCFCIGICTTVAKFLAGGFNQL
jgi:hypothetical protein